MKKNAKATKKKQGSHKEKSATEGKCQEKEGDRGRGKKKNVATEMKARVRHSGGLKGKSCERQGNKTSKTGPGRKKKLKWEWGAI